MKYVLVIGDGMADFPVEELSGKTPLQAAKKPVIDRLAGRGWWARCAPCRAACPRAAIPPF